MESKERFNTIADIKTTALIGVVLSHCLLFYADDPFWPERADFSSPAAILLFAIIDASLVAAFMFCSGFLYALGLEKKERTVPQLIGERAKRVLVPYYLYGAIWVVPLYTLFDIECFGRPRGTGLLAGYGYMAIGVFADHLWFLWGLFWPTLFFILMKPLLKGKAMVAALFLTVGLATVVQLSGIPYFKITYSAQYFLCYFAGIAAYQHRERIKAIPTGVLFALAGLLLVFCAFYNQIVEVHFVLRWLEKLAGALLLLFLFVGLERIGALTRLRESGFWRYTEAHALQIYLLNCPIVYLGFKVLYPVIGQSALLCILGNFVLSMAEIYAITALQDVVKRLFSGRLPGSVRTGQEENGGRNGRNG